MGMANSLTKRARIDYYANQTKGLAMEMKDYFFKDGANNCDNNVNAKKILEIIKENAKLCNSGFPALSQLDKVIFMLLEHLCVVSATLRQINDGDKEVKELCNSAGIN